jgi:hypothetical protein
MNRRASKHEGIYHMVVDGGAPEPAGSDAWEAYRSADAARARGAQRVEVYAEGLGHGPVFVLAPRPPQAREQTDRIRNTVDPDLWAAVVDLILERTGKDGR